MLGERVADRLFPECRTQAKPSAYRFTFHDAFSNNRDSASPTCGSWVNYFDEWNADSLRRYTAGTEANRPSSGGCKDANCVMDSNQDAGGCITSSARGNDIVVNDSICEKFS